MYDLTRDRANLCVVLVDGFSALSFGSIVEPLRFLADDFPDLAPMVELIALNGQQAVSKSNIVIDCHSDLQALITRLQTGARPQAIFVCSGIDSLPANSRQLTKFLLTANRMGVLVNCIGSVTWLMADVGLLNGRQSTIHWKSLAAFTERHLDIDVRNRLFVSDGTVGSCAGELATLDLVVESIAAISPVAAEAVANHFLISAPRHGETMQPGSQTHRLRKAPQKLSKANAIMVENLEEPLRIKEIAVMCNVSVRQLERLFRAHIGVPPSRFYRSLRLERALELVSQTNLTIQEIAVACGFGSRSALSRYFNSEFNASPSAFRTRDVIAS